MTRYACVSADPPWPYDNKAGPEGNGGREGAAYTNAGSAPRYGSMSMAALRALSVRDISADNAHLYLWTTNAFMVEAHELARAWGFTPKTIITWCKVKADGTPSMKTGYYYRGATEHCLFAVRGSLRLAGPAEPTAFFTTERLGHSVKPPIFYEMVERQSPGPRLEMFARKARPGWDVWGDEAPGAIIMPHELADMLS